jgi:hypothetical protein
LILPMKTLNDEEIRHIQLLYTIENNNVIN